MNGSGHAPALITVLVAGLVLWRMYRRIQRNVGRQPFRPGRAWFLVILYPVLAALLAFAVRSQPLALAALLGALAAGAALSIYALKLTRYEVTPEGLYYTPNSHIGIALSLLLAARVVYRFASGSAMGAPGGDPAQSALTPLTLLSIGPFLGYYAGYFIGLLRWRTSVLESKSALTQPPL